VIRPDGGDARCVKSTSRAERRGEAGRQPPAPRNPKPPRSRFLAELVAIVGRGRVLTGSITTRPFCTGYRFGGGTALAVVRPGTLVELWRCLEICVAADKIVIMQAANTGLTGGSTPFGDHYDREVVVINTTRITAIYPVDEGRQVICLAGATLHDLEKRLKLWGRTPHSVIGSSCIGASVVGGICNNSGGSLVKRGPAFTEMALFASIEADGRLRLVNHLGVTLGEDAEAILRRLDRGEFEPADVEHDATRRGSDRDYERRVREIEADQPARFNADPNRLFEASGSAGKVVVFAVRLDTFPEEGEAKVFYIGSNDPDELANLRRYMLVRFKNLPIAAEYMHRTAFDMAEAYGKDTFLAVQHLGAANLPRLFTLKSWLDALGARIGGQSAAFSDRLLQGLSRILPDHLPARMRSYRDRFEHHLILKMTGEGIAEASAHLGDRFPSQTGDFLECTASEGEKAFLHRFAAAGAAVRYRAIHADEVEDIVALDIALKRNERDWCEQLPATTQATLVRALYYGHFFCHVFHQDYIVRKGLSAEIVKHELLKGLAARGAKYPAEHNVGHVYSAEPALAAFYRQLDPTNTLNPGLGRTSKRYRWR